MIWINNIRTIITCITYIITIGIGLVCIGDLRAVIALVAEVIRVVVILGGIIDVGAIIAGITYIITIVICLVRIGYRRAVVVDIAITVTILVNAGGTIRIRTCPSFIT